MNDDDTNNVLANHRDLVRTLTKSGAAIVQEMTPEKANLLHMAVGVAGEAGELLDSVKKTVMYNKPVDITNIIEELGDLEFYMEGVRAACGISRTEVLNANIEKLSKRYAERKFTNQQALDRADKAPGT